MEPAQMDLALYRLFREAARNGTTRLEALSPAIAWDGKHCMFVGRNCDAAQLAKAFDAQAAAIAAAGAQKLHFESPDNQGIVAALAGSYEATALDRVLLTREPLPPKPSAGLSSVSAAEALREPGLGNAAELAAEIVGTWGSLEAFLERGFGRCLVEDGTIKGWCLSEYDSPGQCGVGIETLEPYQRQGGASRLAADFAVVCDLGGLTACWDSWLSNQASVRTALRVGFVETERYKAALLRAR